jgi:hypothetical protein
MKLHKLRELGWTAAELSWDRQAFIDVFDTYLTRFGNTNSGDDFKDNELDNELALYGIINHILLSLVKLFGSEVECYLSKPILKKSDKKSYTDY